MDKSSDRILGLPRWILYLPHLLALIRLMIWEYMTHRHQQNGALRLVFDKLLQLNQKDNPLGPAKATVREKLESSIKETLTPKPRLSYTRFCEYVLLISYLLYRTLNLSIAIGKQK